MSYGIAIDAVLATLLVVTIVYAVILNRKLSALRDAKQEMQSLFGEFAAITERAEQALLAQKDRAEEIARTLERQVASSRTELATARELADDLAFLVEKGSTVADRLEREARPTRPAGGDRSQGIAEGKSAGRAARPSAAPDAAARDQLLKSLQALR